jgi:replicative DNA helicase
VTDELAKPVNLEVEQAVLGTLLSDSAGLLWPQVSGLLSADHFSEPIHARIFEAFATLSRAGKSATAFTLKNHFENDATLSDIGGLEYLARLVASAAPAISLKSHAELLRDLAARRSAIEAAHILITEASTVAVGDDFRPALAFHVEGMQRLFDDGTSRKTNYSLGEASNSRHRPLHRRLTSR